jgi:hypothetical protein
MPASRELVRKVGIFLHIGSLAIKLLPKSPPRARTLQGPL